MRLLVQASRAPATRRAAGGRSLFLALLRIANFDGRPGERRHQRALRCEHVAPDAIPRHPARRAGATPRAPQVATALGWDPIHSVPVISRWHASTGCFSYCIAQRYSVESSVDCVLRRCQKSTESTESTTVHVQNSPRLTRCDRPQRCRLLGVLAEVSVV